MHRSRRSRRRAKPRVRRLIRHGPQESRRSTRLNLLFEVIGHRKQLRLLQESRVHPQAGGFAFRRETDRYGDVRIARHGGRCRRETVAGRDDRIDVVVLQHAVDALGPRQLQAKRAGIQIVGIGQIAAGQPIPVPGDLEGSDVTEMVELGSDLLRSSGQGLFALRVKGHSMVDALINDGDVVVLKQQETCENGETVAVWLKDQRETTLKKFYLEGQNVRLQPANMTMEPIFTPAENVEIQGRLVTVLRSVD